jgi:hypothetical protein
MGMLLQDICDAALGIVNDCMEEEPIVCTAVCILAEAAASPEQMRYLGGMTHYVEVLLHLAKHALSRGDSSGKGCWLHLLSVVVRSLASLSSRESGKMALVELRAVSTLLSVLRHELQVHTPQSCADPGFCCVNKFNDLRLLVACRTQIYLFMTVWQRVVHGSCVAGI